MILSYIKVFRGYFGLKSDPLLPSSSGMLEKTQKKMEEKIFILLKTFKMVEEKKT